MRVLGIETSCDDTSAAVVTDNREILSNIIHTQISQHSPYGGVVPEISARAHLSYLNPVIQQALDTAKMSLKDLDAIAVTAGPGLIGGVMIGVMTAKAMAAALGKPILAMNHLEGHALTARLSHDVAFPYLLLLISGGHCQFLEVFGVGRYRLLGGTIDDAAGEAFDKVARCLDLPYPGGPAIEKLAIDGNPHRFSFPRPLMKRAGCDLSFAGLKTAVRVQVDRMGPLSPQDKADVAAAFQEALSDCLVDRLKNALALTTVSHHTFVLGGGVAANQHIRHALNPVCENAGLALVAPPLALCTDNAAMIAWAGIEKFRLSHADSLDFMPRPRWPLVS